MNNRIIVRQKNKTRDDMIIEALERLEQDLSIPKLAIEKNKQLNQYKKVLRGTKNKYQKNKGK